MSIRRRGDRWLVTGEAGRDEFGVRRRVFRTAGSEDEAKRLDAKLRHELYEGTHLRPSRESVADFCARYLEHHADRVSAETVARLQGILDKHVRPDLSRVSLSAFTPQVAARWKAKQLKEGLAPATVHKHLTFVGAALELALAWGLVPANAVRKIELPKVGASAFHVYTASEQAALLSASRDGSLYVPIALTLATGMRRGELLGLEVDDFDPAGRLHVRRGLTRSGGMGPGKTDRSRRVIVLPQSVTALLIDYRSRRPAYAGSRLILNARGDPWTTQGFASSWRSLRAKAAKVMVSDAKKLGDANAESAGDGILAARFHDLRHTHATELLRARVHSKVVAERLGDSEATVLRVYSHVLPDMQQQAADALEPMLRALLP